MEIKAIKDILEIIWGTEKPKPKRKKSRDKKGRYTSKKRVWF